MKIRHLILSALAIAALATACEEEEEILGLPELSVNPTELNFGEEAGSQNVTIKATRDWMVENLPEWIALDPQSGKASTKEQTVTVTVMPNSGVNRTLDLKFTIGLMKKKLKVIQPGEAGSEEDALLYFNDFDKTAAPTASPFPYCDASDIWKNQSGKGAESVEYLTSKLSVRGNSASNSHNSESYVGSGVNNLFFGENGFLAIKKIALNGATNLMLTFGTERYLYGAEDNTYKHDEFLVSASVDGEHFASLEYAFSNGDLSGTWDLAKAEFAVPAGTEYLYLHFTTTLASAYRIDDVKLIRGGSGTAPDYANGKVIDVSGGDNPGGNDTPATATGDGSLANPYNPAGAANAVKNLTWTSNTEYQKTDKVYVKGKISRIATNGTFTGGGTYGNASFYISEDGSQSNEFYVFRTLYYGGEKYTSGTDIKVGDDVIIYGALMNYKGNTPETVANECQLYSLNGVTAGGETPGGDTPGGDTPGGDTPAAGFGSGTLADPYTPAGAADAVKNLTWTSNTEYQKTDKVYVKGKISRIATNGTFTGGGTYGNASFYISADGSQSNEFYIFRTLYFGGEKYTSGTDIKVGDDVIIYGALMNYKGNTPETVAGESWLYSLNNVTSGGSGDTPGGDTPGGDTPGGDTPGGDTPGGDTPGGDTPGGDATDFSSNVTFAAGTSSSLGKVKVNGGTTEYDCLKMGTSSKLGEGTVTLPAGASKVSFYAVGWNNFASTLVAEIGESKREIPVAANSSVTGNSPWSITVADSDHYTIDLGGALPAETQVKVSTKCDADASGKYTNGRVIVFAIKAE